MITHDLSLTVWRGMMRLAQPFAPVLLRRRLAGGKEHPTRWREKLGEPGLPRPPGQLVWLHAVGLGEVLALSGLIAELGTALPEASFLVTSGTRQSADVFARNLPPRTCHQFLPLDTPAATRRFLDHWQPNLAIWSEQDVWPGLVSHCADRGIPQAHVNARMNDRAFASRRRLGGFYAALYRHFLLIDAQDAVTADHLRALGAQGVTVSGSLKPAARPPADWPEQRAAFAVASAGRRLWLAASTHPEDEAIALAAHARLRKADAAALLVIAPRYPARGAEIADAAQRLGLGASLRTKGEPITPHGAVYIADTVGEMGLWYRLCPISLVGGTFGPVGGHNPWEPARLGSAILHGPHTASFANDYAALDQAGGAIGVMTADDVCAALARTDLDAVRANALALADRHAASVAGLTKRLAGLVRP